MPRIPESKKLTDYQRGWRCGHADYDLVIKKYRQYNQYPDYYQGYSQGEWARGQELIHEAEAQEITEQTEQESCWFMNEQEYQEYQRDCYVVVD